MTEKIKVKQEDAEFLNLLTQLDNIMSRLKRDIEKSKMQYEEIINNIESKDY